MKVIIYSEDTPNGLEVDWPAVPNTGSYVRFGHSGGTTNLRVESADWNVTTDGKFEYVELRLSY